MHRILALCMLCPVVLFCASCTTTGQRRVALTITSQEFEPGDSIVVREVLSNSGGLRVGDKVVVRGEYQLHSRTAAALCLFITTSQPSGPTPISPKQRIKITAGRGTFELEEEIRYAGSLHVSFYGDPPGGSFGGVYFDMAK